MLIQLYLTCMNASRQTAKAPANLRIFGGFRGLVVVNFHLVNYGSFLNELVHLLLHS